MSLIRFNANPSRRQLNQFGLAWLVFFLLLAWFVGRPAGAPHSWVLVGCAVLPPLVGLLVPSVMRLLFIGLSVLTYPIGYVVSHLILLGTYYLVLTPLGLVLQLCKPEFFPKKPDPSAASYWQDRPKAKASRDYFKPY